MNGIFIRALTAADSLDELTALIHRAFAPLGRSGFDCTGVEQSVDTTARRTRRGACFVALVEGRIIGTMTLEKPDRHSECAWYRKPEVAGLHQFAIDPRDQGLGHGRTLLRHAERWAEVNGYGELALETPVAARGLVAFYREEAFRPVCRLRKADKDYASLVLSKCVAEPGHVFNPWFSPRRTLWQSDARMLVNRGLRF